MRSLSPRQRLNFVPPPKVREVPGAGRLRSPSPGQPHSVWVREQAQEIRSGTSSPVPSPALSSGTPAFGSHKRWDSHSSAASADSAFAPQPRGRGLQRNAPLMRTQDISPASTGSGAPSPSVNRREKRKQAPPAPASAATEARHRLPALVRAITPSVPASTETSFTNIADSSKKSRKPNMTTSYARVDDEDAVKRFEREQGFA